MAKPPTRPPARTSATPAGYRRTEGGMDVKTLTPRQPARTSSGPTIDPDFGRGLAKDVQRVATDLRNNARSDPNWPGITPGRVTPLDPNPIRGLFTDVQRAIKGPTPPAPTPTTPQQRQATLDTVRTSEQRRQREVSNQSLRGTLPVNPRTPSVFSTPRTTIVNVPPTPSPAQEMARGLRGTSRPGPDSTTKVSGLARPTANGGSRVSINPAPVAPPPPILQTPRSTPVTRPGPSPTTRLNDRERATQLNRAENQRLLNKDKK